MGPFSLYRGLKPSLARYRTLLGPGGLFAALGALPHLVRPTGLAREAWMPYYRTARER